jgi:hypothetical protein
MLDKKSTRIVKNFFMNKVGQYPDFIYSGMMFDPAWRKDNNLETPLRSENPNWDTPGCYVFFEPCNQNNEIEIMYVGRSAGLRNRITGHWGNYTPRYNQKNTIEEWGNYCWENDYPFCPYVAIFISYGNLRDLEHWLMQLKPKFNIH